MRKGKDLKAFLETAHKRFEQAMRAETEQRELWIDDLKFEAGNQWPEQIRKLREHPTNPRPCLTINKTQLHTRQVCNDIRQNRPQIKVLPVDGTADIETADIYSGLIRNIESVSDADIAYDVAVKTQVPAGIGYFRIRTEMIDAKLNVQEIRFDPIWNPLSVYMDPEIQHPAAADARWCFIVEDVPDETFKEMYPKAQAVDFRQKGRGDGTHQSWFPTSTTVRVAEYYYIERELKKFIETADGEVYDEEGWIKAGQPPPVKTREQYVNCCYWAKITGADILEETKVSTQFIPVPRVAGLESVIDGKRDVRGLVRDARDPARIYNYWVTLNTELIALAPKSPILAPFEAIEGHEKSWDRANTDNLPYLPYNHVDEAGNAIPMPQRAQPPQQSTAIVQAIIQADSDLMGVMGRFEASLGEGGNEKSGKAIIARQRQGDNATFHFTDNLTRAIRYAGRILVDMIPRVYDTKRILRVIGEDGSSDFAQIDPQIPKAVLEDQDLATGKIAKIYNLGVGKYDVTCVAGPSYATKRQEAAETLVGLSQSDPTLMQKAGDLIVKSFDLPGAEELSKRLKAFLPPEISQQEKGEDNTAQLVAQAQQSTQEQLMTQIQPVMQELQQALQQAEQEALAKDQEIQALKQAVANKEMETAARIQEAQIKADAEATKAEQETIRAVLEHALTPEPPEAEAKEPTQPAQPQQPQPMIIQLGDDGTKQQIADLQAMLQTLQQPRKKTIRVTEFDAEGLPIGAEVVETMH